MTARSVRRLVGVGTVALLTALVALATPGPAVATEAEADYQPTFAKDVAPILQLKCQECHQPNSIAPMSLRTYPEVRPWARAIKDRVVSLEMPPWHIDRAVGIQKFKNDRSLSQKQIDTIVKWVDGGAPLGDIADMPPSAQFPDPTAWRLSSRFGEPDLIVASDPYTVAADGQDKWWRSTAETGLTEERWVRAIEIKPSFPGGRKVVHHAIARLQQDEDGVIGLANGFDVDDDIGPGTFMEWAVGKEGEIFPENAGKLMLPGAEINWDIHYHAVGEEVADDVVELGVYFYDTGYVPKYRTILHSMRGHQGGIDIAPGEIGMSQGFTRLKGPARLENFQPHMHMRGKAMSMEAILPDGSRRMLSNVGNFRWNWHINYIYDEEVAPLLPGGTMVVVTAWHDNSTANRENPDPRQWVGNGSRTVDEMAHAWVDVTYLDQDEYDQMVEAREAAQKTADNNN